MSFTRIIERVRHPLKFFRAGMKARWAAFLRENYSCIEEVAVEYDVTFQCAFNWWNELTGPHGSSVCHAFSTKPESATQHLSTVKAV